MNHSQSPAQDRTADSFFVDTAAAAAHFDEAAARHMAALTGSDLVDIVSEMEAIDLERMLAAIKSGDATAAGMVLAAAVADHVSNVAAYAVMTAHL